MAVGGGQEASDLGWGYGKQMRRLMVFSLKGDKDMPQQTPPTMTIPVKAPFFEVEEDFAATGADIYGQCAWCHGDSAISGGIAPDLRASPIVVSDKAFSEVVRDGAKRGNGMPSYSRFSGIHLKSLQHYIRQQAELALDANN